MSDRERKYTVITGVSSSIGYEAAKTFAERGKNLIITARRKSLQKFQYLKLFSAKL